ncbi:unnamed protein product [Ciceribacter sp. T2.26MG-112.2]|nr:unnamed protein product [Ciceribacter naphthalenivorans]
MLPQTSQALNQVVMNFSAGRHVIHDESFINEVGPIYLVARG